MRAVNPVPVPASACRVALRSNLVHEIFWNYSIWIRAVDTYAIGEMHIVWFLAVKRFHSIDRLLLMFKKASLIALTRFCDKLCYVTVSNYNVTTWCQRRVAVDDLSCVKIFSDRQISWNSESLLLLSTDPGWGCFQCFESFVPSIGMQRLIHWNATSRDHCLSAVRFVLMSIVPDRTSICNRCLFFLPVGRRLIRTTKPHGCFRRTWQNVSQPWLVQDHVL